MFLAIMKSLMSPVIVAVNMLISVSINQNMYIFYFAEIASEGLKFRVFEVSLADLQSDQDAERSFRKFRLIAEDVQGRNVLTNFHGMDLTTDKLRSMVKKWQTLIEANVDVKTTDGYLLRVFCIGFTNKDQLSTRKTCYAQHAQVRILVNYDYSYVIRNSIIHFNFLNS